MTDHAELIARLRKASQGNLLEWVCTLYAEAADALEAAQKWQDEIAYEDAEQLTKVRADEREACAQIADGYRCGGCGMDGKVAAAIRAREARKQMHE